MTDRESDAYLEAISAQLSTQLGLSERTVSTLSRVIADPLSAASAAVTLDGLRVEYDHSATIGRIPTPVSSSRTNASLLKSVQQLSSSAGELAAGLREPRGVERLQLASDLVRQAQSSARTAADSLAASIVVGTTTPTPGQIIAAILMAVDAVMRLIGQIIAQRQKESAPERATLCPNGPVARTVSFSSRPALSRGDSGRSALASA